MPRKAQCHTFWLMVIEQKLLRNKLQNIRSGDEAIYLVSPARLDAFLRIIITFVVAVLLLSPVYILFKIRPVDESDIDRKSSLQILVIFLFTLLLSASCSIFTQAKRHEVFAATAAYCAVLVVFLGNASNVT